MPRLFHCILTLLDLGVKTCIMKPGKHMHRHIKIAIINRFHLYKMDGIHLN